MSIENSEPNRISHESTVLWYQAIVNRFNTTNAANTAIDTKSGILLATAVAVLIYAAQIEESFSWIRIIGIVGLIGAIILSLINIHVRNSSTEVHTTTEKESYYGKTDEIFIWQLIADIEDSLAKNDKINSTKASLYYWAVYTFVVSTAFIIAGQYIDVFLNY